MVRVRGRSLPGSKDVMHLVNQDEDMEERGPAVLMWPVLCGILWVIVGLLFYYL